MFISFFSCDFFSMINEERLRFHFAEFQAHILDDGTECSLTSCNPYLNLYIDDEKVLQTKVVTSFYKDFNANYETPAPIPKNSVVKVQMMHKNSFRRDRLMSEWILSPSQLGKRITLEGKNNDKSFRRRNSLVMYTRWIGQ